MIRIDPLELAKDAAAIGDVAAEFLPDSKAAAAARLGLRAIARLTALVEQLQRGADVADLTVADLDTLVDQSLAARGLSR